MSQLTVKHCIPCEGGIAPFDAAKIKANLAKVDGWREHVTGKEIARDFKFKNYYQTMAFVNAIAWISHHENHHPDLEVGYNHCLVRYSTHAIGGLSENDFICAAKVNQVFTHNAE